MARWSFGLRQLFFWTAAIALGLVALRSATVTWVSAMLALAVAALTASILLVIFRQGLQRAWWIGFATCGWMYLLLVLVSWTLGQSTTSNDNPLRADNLLTGKLSSAAYHWLYDKAFEQHRDNSAGGGYVGAGVAPPTPADPFAAPSADPFATAPADPYGTFPPGARMGVSGGQRPPPPPPGPYETPFVNVAHSLWTLLLATLGGCLSWWLYTTRKLGPDSAWASTERSTPQAR